MGETEGVLVETAAGTSDSTQFDSEKMASLSPPEHKRVVEWKRDALPTWRLVVILASIAIGLFLSLMDTTIVATMLVKITEEFGGFREVSWVVLAYSLTYIAFAVIIARLSDVIGRKFTLCLSFFIFMAASMATGASANLNQLIGFRAAQGAGGAGLYALTMIIYPEICPPKLVPLISSILGVIVAIAGVCGPVIGGLFATYAKWRYAFWINGPCTLITGLTIFFVWPNNFRPPVNASFKHLDYVGTLLIIIATSLLVFIINSAAVKQYAWNSGPTISVLVICGLAWISIGFWQRLVSQHPKLREIRAQLPYRLLTNRVMMCSFATAMLTGFGMFVAIVNIPMRAQIVNLYSPIKAGILLLPLLGAMAFGSMLGGALSSKKNNTTATLVASSVLMMIGDGLLATLVDTRSPEKKEYGFEVLLGLGIGLNLSTTTIIASLNVEFEDHAVAQGAIAQIRSFGGALGVAVAFIVLNEQVEENLTGVLTPAQLYDFYQSPVALYNFEPLQQLAVVLTYVGVFRTDMFVCVGISALCLVASVFTYQRDPPSMQKRLEDYAKLEQQLAQDGQASPPVSDRVDSASQ